MKRKILCHIFFLVVISPQLNSPLLAQELPWFKISPNYSILDILYDKKGNLYYAAVNGSSFYFYKSTDKGDTWIQGGNGLNEGRLYRIAIDSTGQLWGVDNIAGKIFKSTNQGIDWITVYSNGENIFSIEASSNNWIWAGAVGKIIFSSDNGNSWVKKTIAADYHDILDIVANNNNYIFAGLRYGGIYRSTDLGNSWEHVHPMGTVPSMIIDDSSYIYALRSGFRIVSYDNGNTWIFVDDVSYIFMQSLYMDFSHNYWAGNNNSFGTHFSTDLKYWRYKGLSYARPFAFIDSLIFVGTNSGLYRFDPAVYTYIGDNYLPLFMGNAWQFNRRCDNNFAGNTVYFVERDTGIAGNKYYLLQGAITDWVRYDEEEDKLYLRWNDSDYVVMDFTLDEGSTFQRILFNNHQIKNAIIVRPCYISIFDTLFHSKGNYWAEGSSTLWWRYDTYYSENLGETEEEYHFSGPGGTEIDCLRKMIRAIINDSTGVRYYSDHVKPAINFQPVFVTNEFNIDWNFSVDHYYSHFDNNWSENFIDSVLMYSYYSNGDSIILNLPIDAINEPNSINYNIAYLLDSTLMKNDFSFYYKIYAVDIGIVPEHSTKPDTGYYELVYDTSTVSMEEINNLKLEYSLSQNYPNPFNPTTVIKYSIEKEGSVELIIYDVLGKVVEKVVDEKKPAGQYSAKFNASKLSSGIYFYSLRVNDFVSTKKMLLLK